MESIMFRIMNLKELHQLEEEIDQMDDAKEKEARSQLIEQIMEKITDYDVHVVNMLISKQFNPWLTVASPMLQLIELLL